MKNISIIGLQWGDEGKGKIVDYFSKDFKVIVRFQGGPNAGHTVYANNRKYIFHQLPSGLIILLLLRLLLNFALLLNFITADIPRSLK